MGEYGRYDPSFTAEISNKMQVPKHIRMGESDHNDDFTPNGIYGTNPNGLGTSPRVDMSVPDRIIVAGQDKHLATRAPPRELALENSIMPADKHTIRVQTPPRTITLDSVPFPRPAENQHDSNETPQQHESDDSDLSEYGAAAVLDNSQTIVSKNDQNASLMSLQDDTAPLVLSPPQLTEEVYVLRQQVTRLHRRMAAMEREHHYRQQRDALVVSVGVVYFVWKVLLWLTRN